MMKILPAFLLLIFFSCSKKEEIPQDIIKPEKMKAVFWDYLRADAYTALLRKDSTRSDTLVNIELQNCIFKHYKITKADFYKSYHYYMEKKPELMQGMLDSIIKKEQKEKQNNFKKELKDLKKLI